MDYENLRSVRQVAESNPVFSEGSLRWLIFNSAINGLDRALVRVGRRVLIDRVAFEEWLESQKAKGDAGC